MAEVPAAPSRASAGPARNGAVQIQLVTEGCRGLPQVLGSGGDRHWRVWIVGWLEPLSETGAERAIVDGATNLKQQIGAASRPAHLLGFIHSAVHQEIGRPFGERGANAQARAMALGVIHQPGALAGEITIQRVQGGPQLS